MKLHKIIFGFSILLLLSYVIFLGIKFPTIQKTIPIHYSAGGADGFGDKIFLWFNIGINVVLLFLIGLILFFPQKAFRNNDNFLETSLETAIKNRQIFLSVLSVIITLIFCGLSLKEIN